MVLRQFADPAFKCRRCYNNAGFMFKTCPLSCGVCEDMKCADGNSTQCQIWSEAGARCLP